MCAKRKKSLGTFPSKKKSTFFESPVSHHGSAQKEGSVERQMESVRTPSYIYLKNNIFYFRYAFSLVHKKALGYSEMRLSLRTGYKKQALDFAKILYGKLRELLMSDVELDYPTIKHRLRNLLLKLTERIDQERPGSLVLGLPGKLPTFGYPCPSSSLVPHASFAGMPRPHSEILAKIVGSDDLILAQLHKDGVFTQEEIEISRSSILRSYEPFYEGLCSYLTAHLTGDAQRKIELNDKVELDISRYNSVVEANRQFELGDVAFDLKRDVRPRENILFSNLIDRYIETKLSDGAISPSSAVDYRDRLNNFIDVVGDQQIDKIDRKMMRSFRDVLRQLPPNRKKRKIYKGKTNEEILKMDIEKCISINTVNEIISAVSSLFRWAIVEGLLVGDSPAEGLTLKDVEPDKVKCDPFTKKDIEKIFIDTRYVRDTHTHAAYFWCPLISLYAGMRLEEVAQLHVADIYEHKDEDGNKVWVFDLKTESTTGGRQDKKLKNKNAPRIIPVHGDLIEIGLLEYRRRIKGFSTRLFPELNKKGKEGKYGKQVGKQFSSLLKRVKVKTDKKYFHSLRHTFMDFFRKKEIHSFVLLEIFGHATPEAPATRRYGGYYSPNEKYDRIISKLYYNIDIEQLSKSKYGKGTKKSK